MSRKMKLFLIALALGNAIIMGPGACGGGGAEPASIVDVVVEPTASEKKASAAEDGQWIITSTGSVEECWNLGIRVAVFTSDTEYTVLRPGSEYRLDVQVHGLEIREIRAGTAAEGYLRTSADLNPQKGDYVLVTINENGYASTSTIR